MTSTLIPPPPRGSWMPPVVGVLTGFVVGVLLRGGDESPVWVLRAAGVGIALVVVFVVYAVVAIYRLERILRRAGRDSKHD